jgi:hypothetical protein
MDSCFCGFPASSSSPQNNARVARPTLERKTQDGFSAHSEKAVCKFQPSGWAGAPGGEHRSGRRRTNADDFYEIDNAAANIAVQGARYPKHIEQMTGR